MTRGSHTIDSGSAVFHSAATHLLVLCLLLQMRYHPHVQSSNELKDMLLDAYARRLQQPVYHMRPRWVPASPTDQQQAPVTPGALLDQLPVVLGLAHRPDQMQQQQQGGPPPGHGENAFRAWIDAGAVVDDEQLDVGDPNPFRFGHW